MVNSFSSLFPTVGSTTDTRERNVALSEAAQSVWAKYDRPTDLSLSLAAHQEDAAGVAGLLWDHWLPDAVRRAISVAAGGDAAGRSLVVLMAAGHDIGKASPAFASQAEPLLHRMSDHGLHVPSVVAHLPERSRVRHELVTQVALSDRLERQGWRRAVARTYADVCGAHHGRPHPPSAATLARNAPELTGAGLWVEVREELIERAVEIARAHEHHARWAEQPLPLTVQVLLSAVVIVADWIASDADLFPLGARDANRSDDAWDALALPRPWRPLPPADLDTLVGERFGLPPGVTPRPVQRAAVDAALAMTEPGLLVIEAEMGSGKTEAALAAAEVLAHRSGAGGVFFALPTMATSNAIFPRVQRWVQSLPSEASHTERSMFLAHSKAALNPDYAALRRSHLRGVGQDGDPREGAVVAHEWLRGRKRGVLSSFVVGTIDQVLFAALKSKHLMLRHLALASKVVVIDEVHSSDDYSRSYLERVLHWLGAYGAPVVLLSATLPSAQRDALFAAYESGSAAVGRPPEVVTAGDVEQAADVTAYPVVSWSAGGTRGSASVGPSASPRTVQLRQVPDDDGTLVELLQGALAGGGCVGVVRNTVSRAQHTADVLREQFDDDVVLLHSRFLATDRAEREAQLVRLLGRPHQGASRPKRLVVVGTQVIEQSLDIDFDLLVTDLAPVDLLLQRLGRLHRHERAPADRPPGLRAAQCVLVGIEDQPTGPPSFPRGSRSVYGTSRLLRSAAVLAGHLARGHLELPTDIAPLVQAAFDDHIEVPPEWRSAVDDADAAHRHRVADQRRRAASWQLEEVPAGDERRPPSLGRWCQQDVGDVGESRGAAHVRDAEDTLEVVVVQRVDGTVRLLPWATPLGPRVVDTFQPPSAEVARAAALCTLRLPAELSRGDALIDHLEKNQFPGWQDSGWLRGELALVLDENLRAPVPGAELSYDRSRGLVISRPAKEQS